MLPVLGDLRLGHPLEPEIRSTPPGRLDPGAVRGAVLVDVRAEGAAQNAATVSGSWQSNVTDFTKEGTGRPYDGLEKVMADSSLDVEVRVAGNSDRAAALGERRASRPSRGRGRRSTTSSYDLE